MSTDAESEWLITEEVAAMCRTSVAALYAARHRGDGPVGVKVGKRVLYRRGDVDAWLEAHREAVS